MMQSMLQVPSQRCAAPLVLGTDDRFTLQRTIRELRQDEHLFQDDDSSPPLSEYRRKLRMVPLASPAADGVWRTTLLVALSSEVGRTANGVAWLNLVERIWNPMLSKSVPPPPDMPQSAEQTLAARLTLHGALDRPLTPVEFDLLIAASRFHPAFNLLTNMYERIVMPQLQHALNTATPLPPAWVATIARLLAQLSHNRDYQWTSDIHEHMLKYSAVPNCGVRLALLFPNRVIQASFIHKRYAAVVNTYVQNKREHVANLVAWARAPLDSPAPVFAITANSYRLVLRSLFELHERYFRDPMEDFLAESSQANRAMIDVLQTIDGSRLSDPSLPITTVIGADGGAASQPPPAFDSPYLESLPVSVPRDEMRHRLQRPRLQKQCIHHVLTDWQRWQLTIEQPLAAANAAAAAASTPPSPFPSSLSASPSPSLPPSGALVMRTLRPFVQLENERLQDYILVDLLQGFLSMQSSSVIALRIAMAWYRALYNRSVHPDAEDLAQIASEEPESDSAPEEIDPPVGALDLGQHSRLVLTQQTWSLGYALFQRAASRYSHSLQPADPEAVQSPYVFLRYLLASRFAHASTHAAPLLKELAAVQSSSPSHAPLHLSLATEQPWVDFYQFWRHIEVIRAELTDELSNQPLQHEIKQFDVGVPRSITQAALDLYTKLERAYFHQLVSVGLQRGYVQVIEWVGDKQELSADDLHAQTDIYSRPPSFSGPSTVFVVHLPSTLMSESPRQIINFQRELLSDWMRASMRVVAAQVMQRGLQMRHCRILFAHSWRPVTEVDNPAMRLSKHCFPTQRMGSDADTREPWFRYASAQLSVILAGQLSLTRPLSVEPPAALMRQLRSPTGHETEDFRITTLSQYHTDMWQAQGFPSFHTPGWSPLLPRNLVFMTEEELAAARPTTLVAPGSALTAAAASPAPANDPAPVSDGVAAPSKMSSGPALQRLGSLMPKLAHMYDPYRPTHRDTSNLGAPASTSSATAHPPLAFYSSHSYYLRHSSHFVRSRRQLDIKFDVSVDLQQQVAEWRAILKQMKQDGRVAVEQTATQEAQQPVGEQRAMQNAHQSVAPEAAAAHEQPQAQPQPQPPAAASHVQPDAAAEPAHAHVYA